MERDVTIFGDDLTENEKIEIREKQLAEIPVKAGGGYKFIYTDAAGRKGKAVIYADTFGSDGIETTFEEKEFESPYTPNVFSSGYEIVIGNEKRIFIFGALGVPALIREDVTPKVQVEYPQAKLVYTSQILRSRIYG